MSALQSPLQIQNKNFRLLNKHPTQNHQRKSKLSTRVDNSKNTFSSIELSDSNYLQTR